MIEMTEKAELSKVKHEFYKNINRTTFTPAPRPETGDAESPFGTALAEDVVGRYTFLIKGQALIILAGTQPPKWPPPAAPLWQAAAGSCQQGSAAWSRAQSCRELGLKSDLSENIRRHRQV